VAIPAIPLFYQPPVSIGATRIIQDKGIYVFDFAELNAWRLRVLVDVLLPPEIIYQSLKPNEPEQYFGVFQVVEGGYVLYQQNIKYLHQQIYRYQNDPAKVAFDAIFNLSVLNYNLYVSAKTILDSIPAAGAIGFGESQQGRHLATPATEIWIRTANNCKIAVHTEVLPLPKLDGVPATVPEPEADNSPSAPSNAGGDGHDPENSSPDRQPTPPYNPPDNDNGRTTPPPGLPVLPGQWFAVIGGFRAGCTDTYGGFRYALPGATNGNITPTITETGQGSCGSTSKDGTVSYDGAVVNEPRDYISYDFDFVPD
jgi:hypothetical protein